MEYPGVRKNQQHVGDLEAGSWRRVPVVGILKLSGESGSVPGVSRQTQSKKKSADGVDLFLQVAQHVNVNPRRERERFAVQFR